MATVVGQASAAATSVAIPAHAAGDLIIVSARGTAAAPSVPAASGTVPAWTTLQSALANSVGLTTVFFVATAATTTTGAFTNATHIAVVVLRPAALKKLQTAVARSAVGNGNNTQTIVYPALALLDTDGSSTGVRIGTRGVAVTAVGTPPTGWTAQAIQPAGASALMSLHTRLGLVANPAADSVATAGTNSAYRAHTIEVEEVDLGVAVPVAATITRAGAVSVEMTVVPPPVSFAIDLATNQPLAGEHAVGEFLVGKEDILALDLGIERVDFLDGLIVGKATVGASLSVVRDLAAAITRAGGITAQANSARGLAATLAGAGAVSADISRVPLTVSFACTITRAAAVSPSMTVTNAAFVNFDATIQGQAAVAAQTAQTDGFAAAIARQAAVSAALTVGSISYVNFAAGIQGQGAVSGALGKSVGLAVTINRAGAVVAQSSRLILLEARIETNIPLCGEHLVGTFIVGGSSGPHAVISTGMARTLSWEVPIQGQAEIQTGLGLTLALIAAVEGRADLISPLNLRLSLIALIQGQADIRAKLLIFWTFPTVPVDIVLPPTVERDWVLAPTSDGSVALAPSDEEDLVLAATEEEDWLLTPTIERG